MEAQTQSEPLKLWSNGTDTYAAQSAEHALELCARDIGITADLARSEVEPFEEVHVQKLLTIRDEDSGVSETKSAREWAAEMTRPGLLCSTEL